MNRLNIFILYLSLFLFWQQHSSTLAQNLGTLTIKVVAKEGHPLADAAVTVANEKDPDEGSILYMQSLMHQTKKYEMQTNEKGLYSVQLPGGKYIVFIKKEKYKPYINHNITISVGKSKSLTVILEKTDLGSVLGKITDTAGEPLLGANVMLEGSKIGTASGPGGVYMLAKVPPGRYGLVIQYIGYKKNSNRIEVKAGETVHINAVLREKKVDPPMDRLELRVQLLRRDYLKTDNETKRGKLKNQMRVLLYKIFDDKERLYNKEISDLHAKIASLEKLQKKRKKNREKIVERRLQELVDNVVFLPPIEKR